MIINFNKKMRKTIGTIMYLVLLIGGGLYLFGEKDITETTRFKNGQEKNRYTIDVILEDSTKRLMCNQNIEYINNTDKNLDKLYFHIYPNAFSDEKLAPFAKEDMEKAYPNGFNEGYIDIKNVLNNDTKLTYSIQGEKNDILEVTLLEPLAPDKKVSIDMKYNVKLPNSLGRFGYGDNTINVTNWFPISCVYDDRGWNTKSYESMGDPFYSETSDFYVNILMPRKYEMATSGDIQSKKVDDEQAFYEIHATNIRDFAFILSEDFHIEQEEIGDTVISTYTLNEEFSKTSSQISLDSIRIFSDLFGIYPYDHYSVVATDFFIGGMEYPNLVMIDESLYTEKNKFLLEYVIAHETAHQWWYSVVGNDEISEPWVDEALTEYSTILYFEQKYGKEMSEKLIENMKTQTKPYSCDNVFKSTKEYRNSTEYSLNVYTKGALVFHEIREVAGDKLFFETLREYYTTFAYENVTGKDMLQIWKDKGVDIDKILEKMK